MHNLVRALIVSLGLLVSGPLLAADQMVRAPVVVAQGEGLMVQIGWFEYKANPKFVVLYCVKDGDTSLVCVAKTRLTDGTLGIVWVDGIPATNLGT